MNSNGKIIILIILSLITLAGCHPEGQVRESQDKYGCTPPPPAIFTSTGIDSGIALSGFSKVVKGEIQIKTKPEVIALLSKAAIDDDLKSYLRCLTIKRDNFTNEQAVYLEAMYLYSRTNPSAQQWQEWQNKNPFPSQRGERQLSNTQGSINARYVIDRLVLGFNAVPLRLEIAAATNKPHEYAYPDKKVENLINSVNELYGASIPIPTKKLQPAEVSTYVVSRAIAKDQLAGTLFGLGNEAGMWWQIKGLHGAEIDRMLSDNVAKMTALVDQLRPGTANRINTVLTTYSSVQFSPERTPLFMQKLCDAVMGSENACAGIV